MNSPMADAGSKGPQDQLNDFWETLINKNPRKVTNIFPSSLYANRLSLQPQPGPAKGKNAAESYEAAAKECRARVKQIIRECHRTNEKFTDPDFDIESDLGDRNCLDGLMSWYDDPPPPKPTVSLPQLSEALSTLVESNLLNPRNILVDINAASRVWAFEEPPSPREPGSVHRIDYIFDKPSFTVAGFLGSGVKQGANGNCWLIAALATVCSNPSLMDKICVARDEECQECGVYGFVFCRDGEWIWTVIDDNLYLRYPDFDAYGDAYDPTGIKEREYKKRDQTGSKSLYFASCVDQNETWLPLLEKAYAKAHGDYGAIKGGASGEAVEDLTGGVTNKIKMNRILSKERLWQELLQANKRFLFSASSPALYGDDSHARQGLALNHAHSIIKAVEEKDEEGKSHRLVLIRNPWGERINAGMGEWNGAWADGAEEWTPYWMQKLDYRFGNDGLFWMSYDDLCKRFAVLDRTRLFDQNWTVVQSWTSVSVAWLAGYLNTKFVVEIKKAGPTIFVLCQLDDRYFRGLEGKYSFDLHFVLQKENAPAGDYIVHAQGFWFSNRSISAEVELEPGKYEVIPSIVASRDPDKPDVYDVVTKVAGRNPQKLRQIGMNYDVAHIKGTFQVREEEKKKREMEEAAYEKKRKEREEVEKERVEFEAWKREKREREAKAKAEAEKEGSKEEKSPLDDKTSDPTKDAQDPATDKEGSQEEKPTLDDEKKPEPTTNAQDPGSEKKSESQIAEDKNANDPQHTIRDDKTSDPPKDAHHPASEKTPEAQTAEETNTEDAQHTTSANGITPNDAPSHPPHDDPPTANPPNHLPPPDNSPPPRPSISIPPHPPPQLPHFPAHAHTFISEPPPPTPHSPNVFYHPDHNVGPGPGPGHGLLPPHASLAAKPPSNAQWSAVCVLGLRVYSLDPEVGVTLVKEEDVEEEEGWGGGRRWDGMMG